MNDLLQTLQGINWDFSDYNSTKYPLDINSIPWYPATFIPPIPKFLIALLTKPGDIVLDPFGGKGTTAVETVKQGRFPIYNDLNPFASDIINAIFYAIGYCANYTEWLSGEEEKLARSLASLDPLNDFALGHEINDDVFKWYDSNTLKELFSIMNLMLLERHVNDDLFQIRKLALSSIFKQASSQPGHFTYVTDNCKPSKLIYKNAQKLYMDRLQQILLASQDFIKQFSLTNPHEMLIEILKKTKIVAGDARNLNWINDTSVNLVLTSPPYLCSQDYIKTMRLTNLFFPNKEGFKQTPKLEIGPRCKRRSKADTVVSEFYSDMNLVFAEIQRILVPDGYFCLVIGQGKSKITESYDTITDLCNDITKVHNLDEIYHVQRKIGNRVIQVGGVDNEHIIIFQKK